MTNNEHKEVTNCPPLWFSKFSEDIADKLKSLDDKISTDINVLASDMALDVRKFKKMTFTFRKAIVPAHSFPDPFQRCSFPINLKPDSFRAISNYQANHVI